MLTAEDAAVPVSMSRAVRDANGEIVGADRRQKVGTFHDARTAWSLGYTAINLSSKTDLSQTVNEQVAAVHGDAIIHLTTVTRHCTLDYFVFPFGLLPFWPGCSNIEITGDIIKVTAKGGG